MASGFVLIPGGRLYYERSGAGEPVILIHADSLDHRMWDGQVRAFAERYDTIRLDMRGFGRSPVPGATPYSFAGDLAAFIDGLGIANAHLVGSSLGGAVAIEFALEWPDRVLSLVLADTGLAGFPYSAEFVGVIREVTRLSRSGDLTGAKAYWLSLPFFARSLAEQDVSAAIRAMVADTSCYRWVGENQPERPPRTPSEHISDIHVPTLVVTGEHDIPDFIAVGDFVHAHIAGSERLTVKGAGHLPNMDAPIAFNGSVLGFLAKVSAKA